jgi:ubiquinone/menaquinone biosynthesis C-methylase UbiE
VDEPDTAQVYEKRNLNKIAARWNDRATTWDRSLRQPNCHLNEDEAYARFLDEVHHILEKRRSCCASGGVIDVGCGTGLVLADVVSHFAWGIGVDISENMIEVARRKCIPQSRFLVADAFNLSAHCPAAAAVLSRGVLLSHYGHKQGSELLKSIYKCLLPRGFIILDFLNLAARDRHQHAPDTKTYFNRDEVRQMAHNAGFARAKILGRMERRVLLLIAEINV